jgi:hypothetical protein
MSHLCTPLVTARPNLPYIIRLESYYPHGFVPGDASPLLSLTSQNAYDKLATSTTNNASYQLLTCWCGILQSTFLKEPDDLVGTTRQPMRPALIPKVTAWPNLPYIVRFGPYRPHDFVPSDASLLLSLTSQNAYDKLTPALLIRPATTPSPVDVIYYTTDLWWPDTILLADSNKIRQESIFKILWIFIKS